VHRPTTRSIFAFWLPLAATWLMMSAEGPFLAAVIARLADPEFNLAAHGVAFAFAILIEAPVIMLLSASTALVEDRLTYRRLRNFTWALNIGATALLFLTLTPAVYDLVMRTLIGLPEAVADLTYGALWILLPWPAAIGIRRFLQGILIRAGRTRLVALGTVIRLFTMGVTGAALALLLDIPGAWVGAGALSAGVLVEAAAAWVMTLGPIRELQAKHPDPDLPDDHGSYLSIARFYVPLALTSVIGLTVQPMLTFFMGRSVAPLASLAVFPVVHALSFVFRSVGLAYQEVAIALLGRRNEHLDVVGRFAVGLGLSASALLALVTFTPLADFWFQTLSGLNPELASYAIVPARILVPLPALSVLLSLQRAVLVQGRRTGPITGATATEVVVVAILFITLGWGLELVGVTAAFLAFVGGRLAGNLYLLPGCRRALARRDDA
jgi:progressive ankylosis protein